VTWERRVIAERVVTRSTRLEYAEELLWLDQKLMMKRKVRNTYLDACTRPDDQSEQWVARTSPVVDRALVERLTLEESGDRSAPVDAKLTKSLGVQWAKTDVMMSPFYKELMAEMEEYKGP
jgi:hypothetical protein